MQKSQVAQIQQVVIQQLIATIDKPCRDLVRGQPAAFIAYLFKVRQCGGISQCRIARPHENPHAMFHGGVGGNGIGARDVILRGDLRALSIRTELYPVIPANDIVAANPAFAEWEVAVRATTAHGDGRAIFLAIERHGLADDSPLDTWLENAATHQPLVTANDPSLNGYIGFPPLKRL